METCKRNHAKEEHEHKHESEQHQNNEIILLSDPNVGVKYSWNDKLRSWMRIFFQTKTFHILVVALVLVDLFIVIFDLVVALTYCGDHPPHTLEEVVHVFHYISISILCLFVLENLLQFYAFGPQFFTKSVLHCVDFAIVCVSLILDVVIANDSVAEIASVLVVVRLWRLARIVHATEHITAFEKETEHHSTRKSIAQLQQQLQTEKIKVRELQRLINQHHEKEQHLPHEDGQI